jgi:exodeoxyribonuclease V beta subunit
MPIPSGEAKEFLPKRQSGSPLSLKQFSGRIDRTWRISSYTSLISGRTPDHEMADHDALRKTDDLRRKELLYSRMDTLAPAGDGEENAARSILAFPRGSTAGIFFHDIFENLDFSLNDPAIYRELITEKLKKHGFALTWQASVLEMIQQVRAVPLKSDRKDGFMLSSIPMKKRLNELAFFFPLATIGPGKIKKIFMENTNQELLSGFSEQWDRLVFSPTRGFMRGYIDMVFECA